MPPPRPPAQQRRAGVTVATLVALAISAVLVWSVVRFASENPEKAGLGDSVFEVGRAGRLAEEVDDRGPFLFQDPLARGTGRNLYVQHLGDDPDEGWLAIEARVPDDPTCEMIWDREEEVFVDCDERTYPPDGKGLTRYPGTVVDGRVRIDLRTPASTTSTTSSSSSSSTTAG